MSALQWKRSRLPLYLGGALIYGVSIYFGSTLYHIYYDQNPVAPQGQQDKLAQIASRPEVYDKIAEHYDSDINFDEVLLGLNWLRWSLFRHVAGDVLEVSAGTGRNLKMYDPKLLTTLTLVDQSLEMMQHARTKVDKLKRSDHNGWKDLQVTFKDVPLEALSPVRNQFDVVVQSFGLCSVYDPSGYLQHLSTFCRPTGKIILLEHGRSKYEWINRILDATVQRHAEKWGCYYNRNIEDIVAGCETLEIVNRKRWHFGTTYCYTLKPKP